MTDSIDLPLVVYGLKHEPADHDSARHLIIFSCIMPGALIPMKSAVYLVIQGLSSNEKLEGYELNGSFERRARAESEQVHQLASALQSIKGLTWLYITPVGLIAKGYDEMVAQAPIIIPKMRKAMEDVLGTIQFEEVPAYELTVPSLEAIKSAESVGGLLPTPAR